MKSYSRRQFLQASLLASSSLYLGSCASIEKSFSGEKSRFDEEVIILGAGLAGLTAAYQLKKQKIPYRIFEASSRAGGRIYTLQKFTEDGKFGELGGEFFAEGDFALFNICKELNIEIQELKPEAHSERGLFWVNGKTRTYTDFQKLNKTLVTQLHRHQTNLFSGRDVVLTQENMNQFDKALYYDNLSVQDFLQALAKDVDATALQIFSLQVKHRFGVDLNSLSTLQLLHTLNSDPRLSLQGPRSYYRISSGMGVLTRALYERVAGAIPDYFVKMEHVLESIREKQDEFQLEFKTPAGKKTYRARQVICTIPFSSLRDVDDIGSLKFSPLKKDLILNQAYATQSKGLLEFDEAFWKKKSSLSIATAEWLGDYASEGFTDSGRSQFGNSGLISVQRGGSGGAELNSLKMASEAVQDLARFYPDAQGHLRGNQNFLNWAQRPWQKGSRSYFMPGQFSRYVGVAAQSEYKGRFLFAGEHVSAEHSGTMQGALATGLAAADAIIRQRNQA